MINPEDRAEFIGQIVDVVEDFLEEKGVSFPETPDLMREAGCSEEEIAENGAILYGENYDALADPIEAIMHSWGILTE